MSRAIPLTPSGPLVACYRVTFNLYRYIYIYIEYIDYIYSISCISVQYIYIYCIVYRVFLFSICENMLLQNPLINLHILYTRVYYLLHGVESFLRS
jgi:hypothetical protein